MNYYDTFQLLSSYPSASSIIDLYGTLFDKYDGVELGWALLCWLCKPIGFYGMVAIIALLTNLIYYNFIKKYVPPEWYWLALFVYIFDIKLFFIPLSMMRQSLVMALFVWSFNYISDRKIIPAILILFFCMFIHKSAFALIPFAFLGYLYKINSKVLSISIIVLFFVLLLSSRLVTSIFNSLITISVFTSYDNYTTLYDAADSFGLGFAICLLTIFIPALFYCADEEQPIENRLIPIVASVSFLVTPFTQILGFIGRLDYYFSIYVMASLPLSYSLIEKKNIKIVFLSLYDTKYCVDIKIILLSVYIAFVLYTFYGFISNPEWNSFLHYHTIFSLL